ncbi:Maltooligosyl trehalose synthase [Legionella quinlivanii]|uniref:Maltooligosyl trehalose synthase n=1 Tax=Legionella quinlivanii TaxID=45073 RepID=A0A0W0Y7R4_9GAMM|nr:malto-oligosyltrehalose synthase [Legionella quinlivanii]KTD52646.1 Maltooligosyl trehalose synthase [Legionella quinlivanii]SEG25601.1 (1->4)-alpha-D-glucan 1-alpha-D-glucosylmutase [Legionella quinlivanii DSM 21216]STY10326.1 Maltooligosyl trehalose synthase [Legionella quinlivanii]
MHIPLTSYRLQLHKQFGFKEAINILPYLLKLGITDVYSSPLLQAQPGSMHGYDVINYQKLNEELGGEEAFIQFTEALANYGMGLCVDIVPNHMAASPNNALWQDVVNKHQNSIYSDFFDIKWDSSDKDKLTYRRFFDINELVCMNTEREAVFTHIHQLILELIRIGKIQALRVDHIDGLRQPLAYLKKLQEEIGREFYVIVEKILGFEETLPLSWPVAGTTGYDWLNHMNQIYIDSKGLQKLYEVYQELCNKPKRPEEIRSQSLNLVIKKLFEKEFNRLHSELIPILNDYTPQRIGDFLLEFSSRMPIYRLYHQPDRRAFTEKILESILSQLPAEYQELGFLFKNLLLDQYPEYFDALKKKQWQQWRNDWEVFSGPVMAKGFEDTAGYNDAALLSLNEVGSSPELNARCGDLTLFHEFIISRQTHWPYSFNTSSTHDTKRSEDFRARLNVLSELADEWNKLLKQWQMHNQSKKIALDTLVSPDPIDEMVIYQSLLGIWPLEYGNSDYEQRLEQFLLKAMRERKQYTSWYEPKGDYEKACLNFLNQILKDKHFVNHFSDFARKTAFFGMYNSLSQLLIKFTTPGLPDLYQGNETWRFDLVDPDNRRRVDYEKLKKLASDEALSSLLAHWQDGRIKFNLTRQLLHLRKQYKALLVEGNYQPLTVEGTLSRHLIAFKREYQGSVLIIISCRWFSGILDFDEPWNKVKFSNEQLSGIADGEYHSLLTQRKLKSKSNFLLISDILKELPFEILIGE